MSSLKFEFDRVSLFINLQWLSNVLRIMASPLSLLMGSWHLLPLTLCLLSHCFPPHPGALSLTAVSRASGGLHSLSPLGLGLWSFSLPGYLAAFHSFSLS